MSDEIKVDAGCFAFIGQANLKINVSKNIVIFNNVKIENADAKALYQRLCAIVASWQVHLRDDSVVDGLNYFVNIQENRKIRNYSGYNAFPDNFDEFLNLLKEVATLGNTL